MWCFVGDYNAVCTSRERRGVGNYIGSLEVSEFRSFVEDMDLIDPPLLGRRFMWYKADGSAMSRLDRFLLSQDWMVVWEVEAQWALNRDVSDHCSIMLKQGKHDWGPKLFRFNNCWLGHPGVHKLVEKCWLENNFQGWKAFTLKEKLKLLKWELKNWNSEVFDDIDFRIHSIEKETSHLVLVAETVGLSEEEIVLRRVKFVDLRKSLNDKHSLLRQKSRVKWLKEGDANTSFFHTSISNRRRHNRLLAIQVEDLWIEEVDQIKTEVI